MERDNDSYTIPIYRLQLVKESEAIAKPIASPIDVAEQMRDLAQSDREQLVCIHLDTRNRPIGRQTVSIGWLNQAPLHPRELFKAALIIKAALLSNSLSIILTHNHPSNELEPSKEDDIMTTRVAKASKILGIPLIDHVILSPDGGYYSYNEHKPDLLKGGDDI